MQVMILGLVLWTAAHLFRRVLPGLRARLGEGPGKMLVAVLSLAAVFLMVIGYRRAEIDPVYTPMAGIGHLNNLLMLIALFLFGVSHSKGRVKAMIRHPMLWSVVIWAVAHLLVNGDLASIILFGSFLAWAVWDRIAAKRRGDPLPVAGSSLIPDVLSVVIGLALYVVFVLWAHQWLFGVAPVVM